MTTSCHRCCHQIGPIPLNVHTKTSTVDFIGDLEHVFCTCNITPPSLPHLAFIDRCYTCKISIETMNTFLSLVHMAGHSASH